MRQSVAAIGTTKRSAPLLRSFAVAEADRFAATLTDLPHLMPFLSFTAHLLLRQSAAHALRGFAVSKDAASVKSLKQRRSQT